MPEMSLAFRMRRGCVPSIVIPPRSRPIVFGQTDDLSRGVKFQKPTGRDTSLAVRLGYSRQPRNDPPVERLIGVDTQEARLTATEGIKVRFGQSKLPKTAEEIKGAINELLHEQIINTQQAYNIHKEGEQNWNNALTTIMNILTLGASDPEEVEAILSKPAIDEKANLSQSEEDINARWILQLPKSEWYSYEPLKGMKTERITYLGIEIDIIPPSEYAVYASRLTSYINTQENKRWNNSTAKRVYVFLKPETVVKYLKTGRYSIAISHNAILDREVVEKAMWEDKVSGSDSDDEELKGLRQRAVGLANLAIESYDEE
jgi:hypothetical protein